MKRTLCAITLLVLMVMSAACSFKIFEDVGSDPHPPTVAISEIILYVEPLPVEPEPVPESAPEPDSRDRAASSPQGRSSTWDSGGFTLTEGQKFQIRVSYTDAGGDIEKFHLRDRDGSLSVDCPPLDQAYFSGTSGTVLCPVTAVDAPPAGIEITGLFGRHRLELWAEDSHLSRSEKVEFIITLVP